MDLKKNTASLNKIGHFAWLGAAVLSISFFGADNNNDSLTEKTKDIQSQIELKITQENQALQQLEVIPVAQNHLKFLQEEGLVSDINITNTLKNKKDGEYLMAYATPSLDGETCTVHMDIDENNVHSLDKSVKADFYKDVKNKGFNDSFYTEYVYGHEVGHCVFSKDVGLDVFNVKTDPTGDFAKINRSYGGLVYGASVVVNGTTNHQFGTLDGTISRLADENFADSFSAASMIKKHNGSDDVINFLNKIVDQRDTAARAELDELNRKIQASEYYSKDILDVYDIGHSIKDVLKPENVKKILDSNSPEGLKDIAFNISNKSTLISLGRIDEKLLDVPFGNNYIISQSQKALPMKGYDGYENLEKSGDYLANDFFISMAKATSKETRKIVAESLEYDKTDLNKEITKELYFEHVGNYGKTARKIYNEEYKEQFNEGKDALYRQIQKVKSSDDFSELRTSAEITLSKSSLSSLRDEFGEKKQPENTSAKTLKM